MLRELSPEARQEVQQFVEFKLRRERVGSARGWPALNWDGGS
jgi:hypothetical protein